MKFYGGAESGPGKNCSDVGGDPVFCILITIQDFLPLGNKAQNDNLRCISASYELICDWFKFAVQMLTGCSGRKVISSSEG